MLQSVKNLSQQLPAKSQNITFKKHLQDCVLAIPNHDPALIDLAKYYADIYERIKYSKENVEEGEYLQFMKVYMILSGVVK